MRFFTFKKVKKEGRYRAFDMTNTTLIKLGGREVGEIVGSDNDRYRIRFMVKRQPTKEQPAPFKWIRLKRQFDTEPEAREALQANAEAIQEAHDLHHHEE